MPTTSVTILFAVVTAIALVDYAASTDMADSNDASKVALADIPPASPSSVAIQHGEKRSFRNGVTASAETAEERGPPLPRVSPLVSSKLNAIKSVPMKSSSQHSAPIMSRQILESILESSSYSSRLNAPASAQAPKLDDLGLDLTPGLNVPAPASVLASRSNTSPSVLASRSDASLSDVAPRLGASPSDADRKSHALPSYSGARWNDSSSVSTLIFDALPSVPAPRPDALLSARPSRLNALPSVPEFSLPSEFIEGMDRIIIDHHLHAYEVYLIVMNALGEHAEQSEARIIGYLLYRMHRGYDISLKQVENTFRGQSELETKYKELCTKRFLGYHDHFMKSVIRSWWDHEVAPARVVTRLGLDATNLRADWRVEYYRKYWEILRKLSTQRYKKFLAQSTGRKH